MERGAIAPGVPMPEPSAANWEAFSELMWLAHKKPKVFEEKVAFKLALAEAHARNANVMRLRSASYDAKVEAARQEWANATEALAAVARLQFGLRPPE